MKIRRFVISNIRSIKNFEFKLPSSNPGWHVILGANGSGKSTIVRSLALALTGPREAVALRQNWSSWCRDGEGVSKISLSGSVGAYDSFSRAGRPREEIDFDLEFQAQERTVGQFMEVKATSGQRVGDESLWGAAAGWFSASFGPFRRFTGGDYSLDRLYFSNPRLAPHLSAFGEDVALSEGLRWLRDLRVKQLESPRGEESNLLAKLISFLNGSDFLPYGVIVHEVTSESVVMKDASGVLVPVELMSDGYRSILSMIFEIMRQMIKSYGINVVVQKINVENKCVDSLDGVIVIDEVDAHLHPSWQKSIGNWFKKSFPKVQFIVTTHSPIVCRDADSVWYLPKPGSDEMPRRVQGAELDRLIHGSILDAYGTDFFGEDIVRSEKSKELLKELAGLNIKSHRESLTEDEEKRVEYLRSIFRSQPSVL